MNIYEVILTETRSKTVRVAAACKTAAQITVEDMYFDAAIDLDDCEPELDSVIATPVDRIICTNTLDSLPEARTTHGTESDMTSADCDKIFTCERCGCKDACDNETKRNHMMGILFEDLAERMRMVCATYGDSE